MNLSGLRTILFVVCLFAASLASYAAEHAASRLETDSPYQVKTSEEEWYDSARGRSLPVKIYFPVGLRKPAPVILFSHGLGGSREAAAYLGNAWCRQGFISVFIQHPGSDRSTWENEVGPAAKFRALESGANAQQAWNRIEDVSFVIDHLEKVRNSGSYYGPYLNLSELGMSGHSFGAQTTLSVCGEQNALGILVAEPHIKAAVYLSPGKYRGIMPPSEAFAGIKVPGMIITGSEDRDPIMHSTPEDRAANFDYIATPEQYLLYYQGAAHQTFGGRKRIGALGVLDENIESSVATITSYFWNAYLRHDARSLEWLKGNGLRHFLGTTAELQRK